MISEASIKLSLKNILISVFLIALEILLVIGSFSFKVEDIPSTSRAYTKWVKDPSSSNLTALEAEGAKLRAQNTIGQWIIWACCAVSTVVLVTWFKHFGEPSNRNQS
jgi:hypothetical protein